MSEIVVVHGYAGSGKSTQSGRLVGRYMYGGRPITHVSAGMRLRAIRTGAELSIHAGLITSPEAPSPLPDSVVNDVIFERVAMGGLSLVDGYPRHEGGVDVFLQSVDREKHRLLGCICLEVSQETSVGRILGRGVRQGERVAADSLREFAAQRYRDDESRIGAAMARIEISAPIERVDANGDIEETWDRFAIALGRLGLTHDTLQSKFTS